MSEIETVTMADTKIGTVVWARLKGYPYWPAIVIPPKQTKLNPSSKYVLFFGDNSHSSIKYENLKPYHEDYGQHCKTADPKLKMAIKAAKNYIQILAANESYYLSNPEHLEKLLEDCSSAVQEEGLDENAASKKNDCEENSAQSTKASKKSEISVSAQDLKKGPKRFDRLKKTTLKENAAQSTKASKKLKIPVSAEDFKKSPDLAWSPKASKKPPVPISVFCAERFPDIIASYKTGIGKKFFKKCSSQLMKTSAKPKTSTSVRCAKKLAREPKRASKHQTQIVVKRSKIRYMPSAGSPSVYHGPSTSSAIPEIVNDKTVYGIDRLRGGFVRRSSKRAPFSLGFVGIGELAHALVANMLRAGQRILIWNRTPSKCDDLVKLGAIFCKEPRDVSMQCDIVFCTVRGPAAITEVCIGGFYVDPQCDILSGFRLNTKKERGFVMMSTIRAETSMILAQDYFKLDVDFLEAQVTLNSHVHDCDIKVICAGSRNLFQKFPSLFGSTKAQFFFISTMLGDGPRMKYAHAIVHCGLNLSIIEGLAVLQESDNPVEKMNFILEKLENVSPVIRDHIRDILFDKPANSGLIRELKETLQELYNWYPGRPLDLSARAFELLKYVVRKGRERSKISAVYDLIAPKQPGPRTH